ncbi:protease inhibitor Inh/omp19 family protein [Methylobacterium phyllosphaerae]
MLRPSLSTFAVLCLSASLGACASSRLDGPRTRAPSPQASLEAVPAMPSGTVTAAPLAPPPGATASPDAPPPPGAQAAASATAPTVIAEPVAPPAPPPPVVTSGRASVVGSWDARDATGANCKVTLSSTPALDLYRATAAGCANKDLARVSAWDFRDGEVYLYQQGGSVAARLRQGGGGLEGALTKSGAALALNR